MNTEEAVQVFDGVMLGDGGLVLRRFRDNANFNMALSSRKQGIPSASLLEYLRFVMGALGSLGVEVLAGHPKIFKRIGPTGQAYDYCDLATRVSPFLTRQHHRWYPDGVKEVPGDISITPISMAHWFMGDGTSVRDGAATVRVSMATLCFSERSIQVLEDQLRSFDLHTGRRHQFVGKGAGIIVSILQDSVNDFMGIIEPYVIKPYEYKIKYRR